MKIVKEATTEFEITEEEIFTCISESRDVIARSRLALAALTSLTSEELEMFQTLFPENKHAPLLAKWKAELNAINFAN